MRNGLKIHFNQGTQQQPQFPQENEEIQMMFVTVLLSETCHIIHYQTARSPYFQSLQFLIRI